ncbi:proline-specific peptidase [Moniliophthora roreri MCA 2997]|uniref:Proline-specific peptidase n=2 Tax=Moniliophthora roreri TaxID=221103 RepID=V2YUW6_MONRO|nr:proline-specific peptidase [Moniliophthora roreri MCA 2997]
MSRSQTGITGLTDSGDHIPSDVPTTTGTVDFVVGDRTFQTWYLIVGDLKKSDRRPLVTLHGGPGMNFVYMKPHIQLYKDANMPIVFYNQIGLRQYPDSPPEFWTVDLFNDELDNLLTHLGIRDDFDLIGHSWGGVFGSDYAARRMHPGLKHLVLANTFSSAKLYCDGTDYWKDQLPDKVKEILKNPEAYSKEEYERADRLYDSLHICKLDPWPADLMTSLAHARGNSHPEFRMRKRLKDWSVIDALHNVTCPTLLVSSPDDEMWEPCVRPFFTNIPKCKWIDMDTATHLPMYEDPKRYFSILKEFLLY